MSRDLMVDIETLGTAHNSVVIQIAIQEFDRHTKKLGKSLVVYPARELQQEKGLVIEEGTLAWWRRQNPKVITSIKEGKEDALLALDKVCKFITKKDIIWCHASFDTVLLDNLFKTLDVKTPWAYTKVRDLRTLIDLAGVDLKAYNWAKKTHDALDDCKFQISYAVDAINKIGLS